MRIFFGWNRFKLKTYTLKELNLEDNEHFPNAQFHVGQSYFHIFWIPVCSLGKRYDLIMDGKEYHVPSSMMRNLDKSLIDVKGKWYAWTFPMLLALAAIGLLLFGMMEKQASVASAETERQFFEHPQIGDGIVFSDDNGLTFEGEVMDVKGGKVKMIFSLMDILDEEVLEKARNGEIDTHPDTLRRIMNSRNELVITSVYYDSLFSEHPDQPIYRKLLIFESEGFPIKYEIIEMPIKEYKSMKKSIGETPEQAKLVKLPSLELITKSAVYVDPRVE